MLTNKLLAALGIAGALFIGATADAAANPWRGPVFRAPVAYRGPIYRTAVCVPRAPVVYSAPMVAPAYAPAFPTPVVYGANYVPMYRPVYGTVGWHRPWGHGYGRRW